MADPATFKKYGVTMTPTVFFTDSKGKKMSELRKHDTDAVLKSMKNVLKHFPSPIEDVEWLTDLEEARTEAKDNNKPMLVLLVKSGNRKSEILEHNLLIEECKDSIDRMVLVRLEQGDDFKKSDEGLFLKESGVKKAPGIAVLGHDGGKGFGKVSGAAKTSSIKRILAGALKKFDKQKDGE